MLRLKANKTSLYKLVSEYTVLPGMRQVQFRKTPNVRSYYLFWWQGDERVTASFAIFLGHPMLSIRVCDIDVTLDSYVAHYPAPVDLFKRGMMEDVVSALERRIAKEFESSAPECVSAPACDPAVSDAPAKVPSPQRRFYVHKSRFYGMSVYDCELRCLAFAEGATCNMSDVAAVLLAMRLNRSASEVVSAPACDPAVSDAPASEVVSAPACDPVVSDAPASEVVSETPVRAPARQRRFYVSKSLLYGVTVYDRELQCPAFAEGATTNMSDVAAVMLAMRLNRPPIRKQDSYPDYAGAAAV